MDGNLSNYGLILSETESSEKFGITNNQEDMCTQHQRKTSVESNTSQKDGTSLSSSASNASVPGSLSQYLPNPLQRSAGHGYTGINQSTLERKESTSDSEKSGAFKIKMQSSYTTLENDLEHQDSESIVDSSSNLSSHSKSLSSVFASGSADLSPVKQTAHQRKISEDWVVFEDLPSKASSVVSPSPISFGSNAAPPEIPQRKGWLASPANSPAHGIDLLTMDNDSLSEHLHRVSPLSHNIKSAGPPIPDRLMSPQRKLPEPSSASSSPASKLFDFRLPPPKSSGSSTRRTLQMTASSSQHSAGPPVPPRKDMNKTTDLLKMNSVDEKPNISSNQWIQFEETIDGEKTDKKDLPSDSEQHSIKLQSPIQLLGGGAESSNSAEKEAVEEITTPENDLWRRPTSTSPNGSLRSSKKKKGGYHHLSDTDDEKEDAQHTSENLPETKKITIQVTDMSPAKPLSRWAPIPNDDPAGSSGNVSQQNSLMDEPIHDDIEIDDEFDENTNRLSADINNLKGFNRADKGSQNNLVDFSESAEQLEVSACGSTTSSAEGDLETIFDMTAQGDTLKRKRKKKKEEELTVAGTPTFQIGCDNITNPNVPDTATESNLATAQTKPADASSNLAPTNPFWCPSPLGDTVSLSSSTSETNPFEKVQFQSTTATPLPVPSTAAPLRSVAGIPILPPPPGSNKCRNTSSGSWRARTRESSVSSPLAVVQQEKANCSSQSPILDSSSDLSSSVFVTPVKSQPASLVVEPAAETNGHSTEDACLGLDVADGATSTSSVQAKVANPDNISTASNSQQDTNILETTLSILDVFSKPLEQAPLPIDIENTDIKTYHAMQVESSFPELRDDSLESLEKFQKAVSVESPAEVHDISGLDKKQVSFSDYDLVPKATEWNMLMRFPREKKVMSSRKWVDIYVRLDNKNVNNPSLQLYHNSKTKDPFFFLSLAKHDWQITDPVRQCRFYPSGSLEEVDMEANKRKVHTVKLLNVHYKEKYAFFSKQDQLLMKTPSGFRHSLKGKQATKLGTENYMELLSMLFAVRDAAFAANRLPPPSKGSEASEQELPPLMNYHSRDEIVFDLRDQFRGAVGVEGEIRACCVAVHCFVTSFLSGDPVVTVTFNDQQVEGCEVARREDIMPSSNDRWVEFEEVKLHRCSAARGYDNKTASVIFRPLDACRFELMRFGCLFAEPELPISIRATVAVKGARVTLRCVLRSGPENSANKDPLTQIPCEDISIRFAIPHSWSPAFRRPGRFRIKSIHSKRIVKRPPGPSSVQGRGAVTTNAVLEASVGSAKYEIAHNAIVWRIPRFPEKNATTQNTPQVLSCKLELSSDRDLPDVSDIKFHTCDVEYTMPSATASSACIRSVHLPKNDRAEKFACYGSQYMYKVDMRVTHERDETNSDRPSCALQ
uniref:Uncharacterized protein LOC100183638 n=1 Tax=Phallusia mammillata TaxID=59560 RepID=A0A6F9DIT3_9ASCI|nr:uncharacterized protein LOC100183638 [Phallusia mammillata]